MFMGDTTGHGGGTAHICHRGERDTRAYIYGEDRAEGGTAGQQAGSFLEVAGPRGPQGDHLYSLSCYGPRCFGDLLSL